MNVTNVRSGALLTAVLKASIIRVGLRISESQPDSGGLACGTAKRVSVNGARRRAQQKLWTVYLG